MSEVIEATLTFAELSDEAKDRARHRWRDDIMDEDWSDYVVADAECCGKLLGIYIRRCDRRMVNDKVVSNPDVGWELNCQGAGASYLGRYAKPYDMMAIKGHAPEDAVLIGLAERLVALQTSTFLIYNDYLGAVCDHRTHSSHMHSASMNISVYTEQANEDPETGQFIEPTTEEADTLVAILREFADWIYAQLQGEYEHQLSDEHIDQELEINEYKFNPDGSIAS